VGGVVGAVVGILSGQPWLGFTVYNTITSALNGGNIGIGFAIPVNMAKNVIAQLKETGKVTRGWLGVMIQNVNQEMAEQFGLERPIGALVGEVSPDSPAEKGGIKPGDIIIEYMGKEVSEMDMLPVMVGQTAVGTKAGVVIFRNGKKKELTITIGELKDGDLTPEAEEETSQLGMTVQELTPELGQVWTDEEVTQWIDSMHREGCKNVNFVTPDSYTWHILKALKLVKPNIPVVWNNSSYYSYLDDVTLTNVMEKDWKAIDDLMFASPVNNANIIDGSTVTVRDYGVDEYRFIFDEIQTDQRRRTWPGDRTPD